MKKPTVFLDLDRTIIYSAAALELPGPDHNNPRLVCVETYRNQPLSYMTEAAARAFRQLTATATVVPSTTRTPAQLARIHLPGSPSPYAIASNGGQLLVDGQPDPDWARAVRERLAPCAPLRIVAAHLNNRIPGARWRTADELFLYAVVDRKIVPPERHQELSTWCQRRGWTVSAQGRKLYAVPRPLTKSAAAHEVATRTAGSPLLAAGDSLLDTDLLIMADAAIRPAHGELATSGFTLPTLAITCTSGARAGEEILHWLLAAAK